MKINNTINIIIGIISIALCSQSLKSQTIDLNNSSSSGVDEIKAALKIEQRNYDNLSGTLREGTDAANQNADYQKSWLRWIDSKLNEITEQDKNDSSSQTLLKFIRNRSESISSILDVNNQNENDLLNQSQLDRGKILTIGSDLMLETLLKSFAISDYPMDVHPEDAIKNNESLKKIKDIPQVDLQVMSGSPEEVANKFMMKQSGLGDIDLFIKAANGFTPGKTKKDEVEKNLGAIKKIISSINDSENWMFILRGLKMKMTDGATASISFDKNGVLKKVTVATLSSGKTETVFDSDNHIPVKVVETDQASSVSTIDTTTSNINYQMNLPKTITLLLQEGDSKKLIEVLQKNLAISNQGDVRSERIKFYNLIYLARLEIESNNIRMASLYAKMADEMLKNNSAFKPDDICLKDIYLSRVRMISGDRKGAEEYLSSAIKLFSEKIDVGYPFTTKQSTLLAGIIEVLFDMPRYLENVDYFKSTVTFIGDPMQRLVASSTDNLTLPEEQLFLDSAKAALIASEVLIKSGNYSDAQKIVDDCIIKMDRGGHVNFSKESIYYLDALALKAAVFKMSGETQSAKETLKDWVENYKQRFSDVVQCSSEQQRLLFSSKQHPLDFLMLMDDPLSVAELLFFYKGSVIDSILNSKSIINNSDDISLKRELANMNLQKSQGNSSQDISSMEQDLANKVRNKFTESDILEVIKNQNFMQLAKCLPESSCFIDYFKYDSFGRLGHSNPHYGAIVITGMGKLAMVKLAESTIIDTLIEKLRKINATFSGNENDTAMSDVCNSLYNELIKPLESYISTSNDYIISPDSKLNFVPFAALIDPVGKFLIEKKSIHYVSSGRDLLKEFQVNPKKNMVIIANPKFDRDTLSSNNKGVFPPLPGTAKEAEQIKGVMDAGSYSITILQDTNATKDAVINLNQPRILHIATHGFNLCASDGGTDDHPTRGLKVVGTSYGGNMMTNVPDKPNPMFKTGLAFCGANDTFRSWNIGQAGAAEGILTAAEVPLINLNGASLVTLSACQTGEGEVVGGEGVFGLRRGFLQSGAKNLLMTLWPIADQETVDIMTEFYKKIAANDDDPGNSLSEVQRQWMPKLKSEKGVCYAINRAAPFIIFTKGKMASRSYAQNDHVSATDSSNTTTQITNPSAAIEDRFNHAICEFTDALSKADAGDAYAQGVVSIYYTIGYKAPKDTAKGLAYALKSAAQKNPLGIYQVGALRELGSGMKKDKAQAHKLMSAAFDGLNTLSGDPYALYDLGYMALAGIGVDQNPKEAARLFKTSADLGYAPSQRMYAKLLEAGVGVPKDLESAMQYEKQYRLQWPEQQ